MNPSRQDAFLLAAVIAVGSVAIAHAEGPAAAPPPGDLSALKPAALSERHAADGRLVLGVGRIEGTLPAGWAALTIAGQTTYRSPDMQQQLRVFAYVADAPLSAEQQDRALTALIEVSKQAEQVIGKFATLTQSAPKEIGRASCRERV